MAEKLTPAGLVVGLIPEDEVPEKAQEPAAPAEEKRPEAQPVKRGRKTTK